MKSKIAESLDQLRKKSPLVHNITNFVVMNNTANALLAIGASPVMAHAHEEIDDIVTIAASVVINMGTLNGEWVQSMLSASIAALNQNKPFVFDPVGVGASTFRTETAKQLIQHATPTVIRGNASEIIALTDFTTETKGVDSTHAANEAVEAAKLLAKTHNCTVVISGETDYIVSNEQNTTIKNGDPIMPKVTGMGCTATAITGACLGTIADAHLAATTAMAIMAVAGENAGKLSQGPGSFQMHFLDALHNLTAEQITNQLVITSYED